MTRLAFTLLVTLIILCIIGPTFLSDPPVRISIDSTLPGNPATIEPKRENTFPPNREWASTLNTTVTTGSENVIIGYQAATSLTTGDNVLILGREIK